MSAKLKPSCFTEGIKKQKNLQFFMAIKLIRFKGKEKHRMKKIPNCYIYTLSIFTIFFFIMECLLSDAFQENGIGRHTVRWFTLHTRSEG